MKFLLGIDLGTTGVKCSLISVDGKSMSTSFKEYMYDIPSPGYAEQNPEDWWSATTHIISDLISKHPNSDICGVGLSGQMHGLVALDVSGELVCPAILHCDMRSTEIVERICADIGRDRMYDCTFNPVFPGFQLLSLLWLRDNEPESYRRIRHVICPKDYIRYRLTGEIGIEATDCSATLLYDMKAQCIAEGLLGELGIGRSVFSEKIHNPTDIAGYITDEAAKQTGIRKGVPVVFGGSDQSIHSVGNGVLEPGDAMMTIGTSGQAMMITDRPIKNNMQNTHTFRHVEHGKWYAMGAMLHAGITLNWFKAGFAPHLSYEDLSNMAANVPPCSDGLAFFPAMVGERTPYFDPDARGVFSGLSLRHTLPHFPRAIMEGVTMELFSGLKILIELYAEPKRLVCAGGATSSRVWSQIQADVYGKEVYLSEHREQGTIGAAVVAGVGTGIFNNIKEGYACMVHTPHRMVIPIAENVKIYGEFYNEVFLKIYPANSEIMKNSGKYQK